MMDRFDDGISWIRLTHFGDVQSHLLCVFDTLDSSV